MLLSIKEQIRKKAPGGGGAAETDRQWRARIRRQEGVIFLTFIYGDEQKTSLALKVRDFNDGIKRKADGDEEGRSEDLNLFTNLRELFNDWVEEINNSCIKYITELKENEDAYESLYRGCELKGFINYTKFENVVRKQIMTFREPATALLQKVTENSLSIGQSNPSDYPALYPIYEAKDHLQDQMIRLLQERD